MIIDPDGLFNGDRLRKCSNLARLYWPYLMLASNGFGRIELSYHKVVGRCFADFRPLPTEVEIMGCIQEYRDNYLLFVYQCDGQVWGQWDCDQKHLNKYKTSLDKRSPNPPEDLWKDFKNSYLLEKTRSNPISIDLPKVFQNIPETIHQNSPLGVGVVVGEGKNQQTPQPENSDQLIWEIAKLHPANDKLRNDTELPPDQLRILVQRIETDGADVVRNGTKGFRQKWEAMPEADRKFATADQKNPFRFWNSYAYREYQPALQKEALGDMDLVYCRRFKIPHEGRPVSEVKRDLLVERKKEWARIHPEGANVN